MTDRSDSADAFNRATLEAVERCKQEFGYNPTYWLRMIHEYGAVEAAKRLLRGPRASDGFTRLWEEGRLDLSVEFLVLLPEFASLFTDKEKEEARRRLALYEFDVDQHLRARRTGSLPPPVRGDFAEEAAEEKRTEAPIVRAVVSSPEANTIWPTLEDLQQARTLFGRNEPRDVFYRAATDLVELALRGQASVTASEALAVLLQTWNRPFYQYRRADEEHFREVDALLERYDDWLRGVRPRTIDTFDSADEPAVRDAFQNFESVLGPVGAAKALHLLAPRFLPLWDRAIAVAYGLDLGRMGTNGSKYVQFMRIVMEQKRRLGEEVSASGNVLKALDEYNYCRFTKGWLT